ncbi:L-rhamnose/proton symporter RhaT [Tunturiibacter empetritectus]|uniref:L-rhamnose/proton symporter RhaT n=3 Tax=Tunturiibacter empetritectus TaxID=3069691 RepID=UPI003D9BF929
MTGTVLAGVGLTMVAGAMSGNCMLPMKYTRRWRPENVWFVFSVISLLLLPWVLAFALVHQLAEVYRRLPFNEMMTPLLFGAGWGVAQILFGVSIRRLGMSVGYAIVVGLGAVLGTLVPLFVGQRTFVSNSGLVRILAGVVVMVLGIALTAWGGQIKERARATEVSDEPQRGYLVSVLLAMLCGVLAPMLNYAFAFGQGLAVEAVRLGNSPVAAAYAVWPVALLGGLIPNIGYSVYLLQQNSSWAAFGHSARDVFWPALMGVLWMGAFALYGMSAVYLGALGTSIGWGLFQIFMIMAATMSGLLTAEWRGAPRNAMALLATGMAGLIGATLLLSFRGH